MPLAHIAYVCRHCQTHNQMRNQEHLIKSFECVSCHLTQPTTVITSMEPVEADTPPTPPQQSDNHPPHYNFGKFEVADVLEDWFPSHPLLWQVGKYIARALHKGNPVEDLKKAAWYLQRQISKLETADKSRPKTAFEAASEVIDNLMADQTSPPPVSPSIAECQHDWVGPNGDTFRWCTKCGAQNQIELLDVVNDR